MPDTTSAAGWNTTDDGAEQVPVRQGRGTVSITPEPVHVAEPVVTQHIAQQNITVQRSLALPAILGIAVVAIAMTFYTGVDSLRGSLMGQVATESGSTITITALGTFDPASLTVVPGTSITITNANADPQVLKSKDSRELFSVQVIFEDPFTFTVPATASGSYHYVSETLPADQSLTITVLPAFLANAPIATTSSSSVSSVPVDDSLPPIPFLGGDIELMPAQSSVSSSVSSSTSSVRTTHGNETVQILLGGATTNTSQSAAAQGSQVIPTNPYPVGSVKNTNNIATTAKNNQELHGGAPLMQHRPKTGTATGPEVWIVLGLSLVIMFGVVQRKSA